jgi:D12 class N6 adenine-specific DNA methyltransferase
VSRLRTKIPLRYPGGKQRFLNELAALLPEPDEIAGRFVEPFVGGGSVFFSFGFKDALLSDVNEELITLHRGIRYSPRAVWKKFRAFPSTKPGYYAVRNIDTSHLDLAPAVGGITVWKWPAAFREGHTSGPCLSLFLAARVQIGFVGDT